LSGVAVVFRWVASCLVDIAADRGLRGSISAINLNPIGRRMYIFHAPTLPVLIRVVAGMPDRWLVICGRKCPELVIAIAVYAPKA